MTGVRRWSSPDGRFSAVLSAGAADHLERLLRAAQDVETGGILIGRYEDQCVAAIEEVTGPAADSAAGRTWFVRGTKELADLLLRRWRASNPTYYLGEWHHHPTRSVAASAQDFGQMKAIAGDAAYRCPEPLMLISGLPVSGRRTVRAFLTIKGHHQELVEILTHMP